MEIWCGAGQRGLCCRCRTLESSSSLESTRTRSFLGGNTVWRLSETGKGGNWSQCRENHTRVTHSPVSKSRDCGPPETPTHGYFEGRDFKSGSTITYYCQARYRLVGTQHQQCIDGEWTSAPPICELIQEAPKPAELELEKALLAFQESKELCKAIKKFTQRLKKSDLTMEKVKYSLERKKAKLKAKMLL
ncbi:PREDICTED: C4b-binding protein beta chain isoform X2 [Bison bison bison]|uniref:C4b-binding protein beta chain isoform X2 n=1 Tax=Bison bison bison TaxID=43346 RepID=A0A6P3IDD7_BISBB|nr:PREDICTED: C4b-binding protein beta chain isoform X2 [Bison bison bison]